MSDDATPTTSETWLAKLTASDPDDRQLAVALVERAGGLAQWMRRGELEHHYKSSVSDIVTAADRAAEADVEAALIALRPDDGIIGEEGAARESQTGRTWLIDPVDGTYNYAHRLIYWCAAIALRGPADELIGAVRHPVVDETWLGVADDVLTLNGEAVAPLADRELAASSIATYIHPSRLLLPDIVEPWTAVASAAATMRWLGSGSTELAAVAGGRLGGFLQHSTADWDWYPGIALVRAAGGVGNVVDHRGSRWFIAGNAQVVAEMSELLLRS